MCNFFPAVLMTHRICTHGRLSFDVAVWLKTIFHLSHKKTSLYRGARMDLYLLPPVGRHWWHWVLKSIGNIVFSNDRAPIITHLLDWWTTGIKYNLAGPACFAASV